MGPTQACWRCSDVSLARLAGTSSWRSSDLLARPWCGAERCGAEVGGRSPDSRRRRAARRRNWQVEGFHGQLDALWQRAFGPARGRCCRVDPTTGMSGRRACVRVGRIQAYGCKHRSEEVACIKFYRRPSRRRSERRVLWRARVNVSLPQSHSSIELKCMQPNIQQLRPLDPPGRQSNWASPRTT